jgi:hypothetical protein
MGIESGVMGLCKGLLAAVIATALLAPATAFAAPSSEKRVHRKKITVHPHYRWRGYGFLPGYRPEVNNLDRQGRSIRRELPEIRYWHYGQLYYGWGRPGFYRGRWTGGSFGPCWTSTPIGMMPTCGQ